jgi:hypothetical protein
MLSAAYKTGDFNRAVAIYRQNFFALHDERQNRVQRAVQRVMEPNAHVVRTMLRVFAVKEVRACVRACVCAML